jgi:serine/threonine protein kinase
VPVALQTRELIARGAQGSVFLVFDRSQGRFLALKLVDVVGGEGAARRLIADLLALSSGEPDAPGAVIDFGRAHDAPAGIASAFPTSSGGERIWILMAYIHGPNARELAEGDRAFGPTEVAALLAQVATRLRGLQPGRAHLDLKAENVIVDRLGRAHVVDFHMGTTAGTPGCAAPEQRGAGGTPGPASDLYALGKLGAFLLARRFPKAGDDPELFPQLPEAAVDLPAGQRQAIRELGQLLRRLCHPDPAKRGKIEEVAKRLIEIAAALGGPDLTAPLAASFARAKLPERFERLTAAIAKETGSAGKEAPAPELESKPGRRGPVKLFRIVLFLLAVGLAVWFAKSRQDGKIPFLDPPPRATPVASAAGPGPCRVSPPARLLGPLEAAAPEDGLFQETVVKPAGRVSLRVLNGPEVLSLAAPQPGDDCKIDLPPGIYRWNETYPNGKPEGHTVLLDPGGNERDETHNYVHSAPPNPDRRDIFRMLKPEDGPTFLVQGPLWLETARWNPAAGTIAVAPHGAGCHGPTRPLPPFSDLPGSDVPSPHLGKADDICAFPKASPHGLGLWVAVVLDTRPPKVPIDPAKRFTINTTFKAIGDTTFIREGPLFVTGASWNDDDGFVSVAQGHCERRFTILPHPTDDLPVKIEKGESLCAMPDPVHLGGNLIVHLEGYWP